MDLREWPTEAFVKSKECMAVSELTDHEGSWSWASRIEGLWRIYVFCKKQTNMTHFSSGKIWFDIIDVELLTPADETSCNTCLKLYY